MYMTVYMVNIHPIFMKPAPIERSRRELSIGTGFIKIGGVLRKLWSKQMGVVRCVTKKSKIIVLRTMEKMLRTMKKVLRTSVKILGP